MEITRRSALGMLASAAALDQAIAQQAMAQQAETRDADGSAPVRWLDGSAPPLDCGVTFGVPWPRGSVRKQQSFTLTAADGKTLPTQTWDLAYWPDGSVKFTAVATVAGTGAADPMRLARQTGAKGQSAIKIAQAADAIEIDTGKLKCRIPRSGSAFLDSLTVDGRVVARQGRLSCRLEDRSDLESQRTLRFQEFTSTLKGVTVEQSGPVRAVVRIEGMHKADEGTREWLPFTVRLYFYAGLDQVRLVHTIVFDGEDHKDFVRGLGLVWTVPMREQVQNRHVRFSGEGDGLWSEPVEPATGSGFLGPNVYNEQLAGKRIPNRDTYNQHGQMLLDNWADWEGYKLSQPTADGFTIQKRATPESCWIDAAAGHRASGLVFVGDVTGGLAVGVKDFWQSYPAALEVARATGDAAELHVWLWSPDATAMDLRHYDTRAHTLAASYEDVQPGFSTPHGVARTSEMTLFACGDVPAKEVSAQHARMAQVPPLLATTPEHIHSAGVFGIWSLPGRSTPVRKQMEDQLDAAFDIYHKEVDQRRWYGFWNYGDVMHQHDGPRHMWRYDIGGYAWDNTELGTNMWLWYTFLRTGRADVYRMAAAMARHTSEVDVYHLGRFNMLGSRHNVRHWGCGAKEPRISQAPYHRFYYYLTADERMGDLMRAVLDVDVATIKIDPMRLASPLTAPLPYPGRVRGGPDWLAFIGNWMTEWERTGDNKWRDKIVAGMDSLAKMPYGFMTGPNNLFGYDPATGKLYALVEEPSHPYNLTSIQGGAEVVFELNELIDHPGFQKVWLHYCRLHNAPPEVIRRDASTGAEGNDGAYAGPGRLAAYLYYKTGNAAYLAKTRRARQQPFATTHLTPPEVLSAIDEVPRLSTNSTAQGCLEAIEIMEMCGDKIPG